MFLGQSAATAAVLIRLVLQWFRVTVAELIPACHTNDLLVVVDVVAICLSDICIRLARQVSMQGEEKDVGPARFECVN